MPIEVAPPKYVSIVNAVQRRIVDGVYPPGSKIPSEAELAEEFGAARPTVVRALNILDRDGWLDAQQGKGRFVLGRPGVSGRRTPEHVAGMLGRDESAGVRVLKAGPLFPSQRAASALGIDTGTPVVGRQYLVVSDLGPIELGTVFVPVELASGTGIGQSAPMAGGLLRHLGQAKNVEFDHAVEKITARAATAEESSLLEIGRRECVLSVLVTVFDRAAVPLFVTDVVVACSRHELEDAFPIS